MDRVRTTPRQGSSLIVGHVALATPARVILKQVENTPRTPGYRTPDQEQADVKHLAAQALGRVIEQHLPMATGKDWNAESLRAVVAAGAALLDSS